MGLQIDDPSITSFIAVIQVGAIAALVIYLWSDIWRLATAWFRGLFDADGRRVPAYREAWMVIIGSLPIVLVGILGRDLIKGPLRSLWVVAVALIVWGGVMLVAEAVAKQNRHPIGHRAQGRADHRRHPGAGADPRHLPVRRHHLGRPDARPGPGLGRPATASCSASRPWSARRCWSCRTPSRGGGVGCLPTLVGTIVSFVTPTSRSPGCSGSSPGTPSGRSSGTAGRSARGLIVALAAGLDHRDGRAGVSPMTTVAAGPARPVHREHRRRARRAGARASLLDDTGRGQADGLRDRLRDGDDRPAGLLPAGALPAARRSRWPTRSGCRSRPTTGWPRWTTGSGPAAR